MDLQKKTLGAAERDEEARAAWRERVGHLDPKKIVFVDECGTNIGLTPLWARAPKGERAFGKAPRNRGKNTTLIASLSLEGMGPSMSIEGTTDGAAFEVYVREVLGPALVEGQVVILDNLGAHRGGRVRELIEARGCELIFLPAYSPDFSPIEEAFSKMKAVLRRAQARSKQALHEAIAGAFAMVSGQDARGWFTHCGYEIASPNTNRYEERFRRS